MVRKIPQELKEINKNGQDVEYETNKKLLQSMKFFDRN